MEELLIHPSSRFALSALATSLPHALLLVGPEGVGKQTIAIKWAQQISDPPIHIIEPDEKGSISIETIRHLYVQSRNKQSSQKIILINQAETMSVEAQNAFLKLLEEPVPGITFLLTAPRPEALLPTVLSRTQAVRLHPLDNQAMETFLTEQKPGLTQAEKSQLLFIAQGRPGTAAKLLEDPDFFDKERLFMQQAKLLLNAKPYQRYLAIAKLSERSACIATLKAMSHITHIQICSVKDTNLTAHWLKVSDALEAALNQITHNGNIKAQLLRLFASW